MGHYDCNTCGYFDCRCPRPPPSPPTWLGPGEQGPAPIAFANMDELRAWDRYVAGALADSNITESRWAAEYADTMLTERRERIARSSCQAVNAGAFGDREPPDTCALNLGHAGPHRNASGDVRWGEE